MLLLLLIELRLKIYSLVFGAYSCRYSNTFNNHKHQIAISFLLINRQIYAEARALTFQLHTFDFRKWGGIGPHYCPKFLRNLRERQRRSIRRLKLGVVQTNLICEY